MNQKNSLGLNKCFLELDDPFQLFESWFEEAKYSFIAASVSSVKYLFFVLFLPLFLLGGGMEYDPILILDLAGISVFI